MLDGNPFDAMVDTLNIGFFGLSLVGRMSVTLHVQSFQKLMQHFSVCNSTREIGEVAEGLWLLTPATPCPSS